MTDVYFPFVKNNMNIPIAFKRWATMLPLIWPDGSVWECDAVYVYDEAPTSDDGRSWTLVRKAISRLCPQKDLACPHRLQDASNKLLKFPDGHGANVWCVGGTWSTTIEGRYIAFVVRQTAERQDRRRFLLAYLYN